MFFTERKLKTLLSVLSLLVLSSAFCCRADAAEKYGIKYAKKFNIEYLENNIKIVTDSVGSKFLLVPEKVNIPEKLRARKELTLVRTPVKRAFFASTTYVSYLSKLDPSKKIYSSIAVLNAPASEWRDPEIVKLMKNGNISYFPHSSARKPGAEKIMELAPDVLFSNELTMDTSRIEDTLRSAGIVKVSVDDFLESSDYGYMEWIKFFGAFYNMDERAHKVFNENLEALEKIKKRIEKLEKEKKLKKTDVAIGSFSRGIFYTVTGESTFSIMAEKAGGHYLLDSTKGEGTVPVSMEAFFNSCKDADVLIYKTTVKYMPDRKALRSMSVLFPEFKAWKTGNIYVYDNNYYMNSAEVKEKFEDLVYILHPELLPGHRLKHYIKLGD